jgi:GDPmannose 4,6-dehydratase
LLGDYVEAMWLNDAAGKTADDYVVATGETRTVREFLQEVFDLAELDVREHVRIDSRLFRPHEVPLLLGSPTKAKQNLGWEPKVDFRGLAQMMFEEDLKKVKSENF